MNSDGEGDSPSNRHQRAVERDRRTLAEEVLRLQGDLAQRTMADLAVHLEGSFPKYHGDPAKDGSFRSFINDYQMACDRFGFDEEKFALWLSSSLKGHALKIYKELVRDT